MQGKWLQLATVFGIDTVIVTHYANGRAIHSERIVENSGHNWRKVDADIKPTREQIIEKTIAFLKHHLGALPNRHIPNP